MRTRLKFTLCILGFFSLWALRAAADGPAMYLPETAYDFGEVEEGTVVTHDFAVKNTGPVPLEIKEVRPG
jgi:Protein of unknown function (DUF1573)